MRRSGLVTGLVLGLLAAGPGQACDRRLRDLVPPEGERTELEANLLEIVEQVEDCMFLAGVTEEQRQGKLAGALDRWDELLAQARKAGPAPGMATPPEEYQLVLDSVDGYARRLRAAWEAGDEAEAKRQEYALQHVVLELYGSNPGRISKARAVHYTVTTFEHLPALDEKSVDDWKVRAELLQRRLERWATEVGEDAETLGSIRLLRTGIAGLRVRLHALAAPEATGAAPLRARYIQEATAAVKDLDALAKRAPGAALRASWSRRGVPEDLQAVPSREEYPSLDRPAGT